MGKVNVYLPDELEAAVRDAGLAISPICQAALRDAVDEVHRIRSTGRGGYTVELTAVLDEVTATARGPVDALELAGGVLRHGDCTGARVLTALGVELPTPEAARRTPAAERGALTDDALDVLAAAYRLALELRHPAVGTEHVVLALPGHSPFFADLFAALGIDDRALRQQLARHRAEQTTDDVVERVERELGRLAAEVARLKRDR